MASTTTNIPAQIKELAYEPEIYEKTSAVAKKFDLHIDQLGELDAEIIGIFIGSFKSNDFIDHIVERLEIDRGTAVKIAEEVNKEIFQVIKAKLQADSIEADKKAKTEAIGSIEKAGDFTIIPHEIPKEIPLSPKSNNPINILSTIEDKTSEPLVPKPVAPSTDTKETPKTLTVTHVEPKIEPKSEPLIEQLLSNTVTQVEHKIVQDETTPPPSAPIEKKADLYREPI